MRGVAITGCIFWRHTLLSNIAANSAVVGAVNHASADADAGESMNPAPPDTPRILLVEDDPSHVELISRAFEDGEFPAEINVVRSISEAWDAIMADEPDLLISDYRLPDGEGVELVPDSRGEGEGPFPVVLMTSQGDEQIAVAALKAGAFDYLVKSDATFLAMPRHAARALREWRHAHERRVAQEQMSRLAERLQILHDIDQDILVSKLTPDLGTRILTRVRSAIPYFYASILIFDRAAGVARTLAGVDRPVETGGEIPLSAVDALAWSEEDRLTWCAEFPGPDDDGALAGRFAAAGLKSYVIAPILVDGEAVGCVNFGFNQPREYSREIGDIVLGVASQIAIAFTQTQMNDQIARHAAELEERVAERTADLERTNAKLQHEIGERVVAERELAAARDRLEERVAERTAALMRANSELQQEMVERQLAQEKMRESEERTRSVIETALDAVITMDEEGRISGWNPQAADMFGFTAEEAVGLPLADTIIPSHYRDAHREGLRRYLRTDQATVLNRRVELSAVRKDGEEFPVELAISNLTVRGRRQFSAFVRDITERKETESILVDVARGVSAETGDAFFHSLVEHLGRLLRADHVFIGEVADEPGRIRTTAVFSDGQIVGNIEYDLLGTPCACVIGGQIEAYERDVQGLFPDDQLAVDLGVEGYVGAPLYDTAGEPIGILAVCYRTAVPDVERVKSLLQIFAIRVSGEIERVRSEAARASAERELTEQRALSMRSDRLRSLGEMSAGIAHELNQPLVGVRGLAEHLKIAVDRGWDLPPDKIKDRATRIIDQADRMTHIIEHIRVFSREAGRPEHSPVKINEVVTAATSLLGVQFRTHGFVLEESLAEDLPLVSANPFSLEEVLLNLIGNARDATESAAIPGALMSERPITVSTLAEDGHVLVTVSDHGCGIPEEVVSKVFDPFFTTKDPDKGTGLGLSISKSIIDEVGGELEITSTPGEGTTCTIRLPVAEQTETA